jgi:hypothetical protein
LITAALFNTTRNNIQRYIHTVRFNTTIFPYAVFLLRSYHFSSGFLPELHASPEEYELDNHKTGSYAFMHTSHMPERSVPMQAFGGYHP